jgi:alpha-tubulin suppressor-like RCC1 family protein
MSFLNSKLISHASLLLISLLLTACGGGGGGGKSDSSGSVGSVTAETGVFIDGRVSGLRFESGSKTDTTDVDGRFEYEVINGVAQPVTFFIGDVVIGSAVGQDILTPLDIVNATSTTDIRVINLLRLLQTLDADGNPENGIEINQTTQFLFDASIQLDLSTDLFDGAGPLVSIFAALGIQEDDIVDATSARQHFENTILQNTNRELFSVGGVASGVTSAVELSLGSEVVVISQDQTFTFNGKLLDGAIYQVSLLDQGEGQSCILSNASGSIDEASATNVILQCEPSSEEMFFVGGNVTGLGGELRLQNGDSASLSITSNGSFQFPVAVQSGQNFNAQIVQQPIDQVCVIQSGTGTVNGSDISSIAITCNDTEVPLFFVSGSITGLTGSVGLSLNGADALNFTGTTFDFSEGLEDQAAYTVSITSQPVGQQCSLSNAVGSINADNVSSVAINCVDNIFDIGGSVSGLSGSLSVSNGTDQVDITENGAFIVSQDILTGTVYGVRISQQPEGQTCSISGSTGTVSNADISSVVILCEDEVEPLFSLGGSIFGLTGTLQLSNGDDVETIQTTGDYIFTSSYPAGTNYDVRIVNQPVGQLCSMLNNTGTIGSNNVTNVDVACNTNRYDAVGTVTGHNGAVMVRLSFNDGVNSDLSRLINQGSSGFTFSSLPHGTIYNLDVVDSPVGQSCVASITNGTITGPLSVSVTCNDLPRFSVGGSVTGLSGELELSNGSDALSIAENGPFTISTDLLSGINYDVEISQQPVGQVCSISNSQGSVDGDNVSDVAIVCSTNQYQIAGSVSGHSGSVELTLYVDGQQNAITSVAQGSTSFDFGSQAHGVTYLIEVSGKPTEQNCPISNSQGTLTGVVNATIGCTDAPTFSVGGSVTGLNGSVVLINNGADQVSVDENTNYTFSGELLQGQGYNVEVLTQPEGQTCVVSDNVGTVGTVDISGVNVSCTINNYLMSGTVSGHAESVTVSLAVDGVENTRVLLQSESVFEFGSVAHGQPYQLSVTQPFGQSCVVTNDGTGTHTGAVDAVITCSDLPRFAISGDLQGIDSARGGIQLSLTQNESASPVEVLNLSQNGDVNFASPLLAGDRYNIAITDTPDYQTCAIQSGGAGQITGDVSNLLVVCSDFDKHIITTSAQGLLEGDSVTVTVNENSSTFTSTTTLNTELFEGESHLVQVSNVDAKYASCSASPSSIESVTSSQSVIVYCQLSPVSVDVSVNGLNGEEVSLTFSAPVSQSFSTTSSIQFDVDYNASFTLESDNSDAVNCVLRDPELATNVTADTTLQVDCSPNLISVSGSASGLSTDALVVVLTQIQGQTIEEAGRFNLISSNVSFSGNVIGGSDFSLDIESQPEGLTCLFAGNARSVSGASLLADQENVNLSCSSDRFDISYEIDTEDNEGASTSFTSLLQQNEFLGVEVLSNTEELTSSTGVLANDVGYNASGVTLSMSNQPEALSCVFNASGSTLLTLPLLADKSNTSASIYALSVAIDCVEKAQHILTVQLQGLSQQVAPSAEVVLTFGAEDTQTLDYDNLSHSRQYYEGASVSFSMSESINGFDCGVSQVTIGDAAPSSFDPVIDTTPAISLTDDVVYTVSCEGTAVPLNLIISGTEREFAVDFDVNGETRAYTRTPFSQFNSVVTFGQEKVGSSLSDFKFTQVPMGAHGCFLQDQLGLVENGELSGDMPIGGANIFANCVAADTVGRAANDPELIPDAGLRQCLASLYQSSRWANVYEISCPYEEGNTVIESLEGLEIFSNVSEVNFTGHNISSVTPLLALPDLEFAYMANNNLSDEERARLEDADSILEAVTVSGSGREKDAQDFDDVSYSINASVEDDRIYVLEGTLPEVHFSWTTSGCRSGTGNLRKGFTTLQSGLSCNGEGDMAIETGNVYSDRLSDVSLRFEVGGDDNNFDASTYFDDLSVEVVAAKSSDLDDVSEIVLEDFNLNSCLHNNFDGLQVINFKAFDMSVCNFGSGQSVNLAGIEQLFALESVSVGDLVLNNAERLNDLALLTQYSSDSEEVSSTTWQNNIADSALLSCVESTLDSNPGFTHLNDVTSIMCEAGSGIADLSGLGQFTQLQTLDLNGALITKGISALEKLPLLRTLDIGNTLVRPDIPVLQSSSWTSSSGRDALGSGNPRYSFNVSELSTYTVELESSIDTFIYLLDENNNTVGLNNDGGIGLNSLLRIELEPGTYYAVAATYSSSQSGSFVMQVTRNELKKIHTPRVNSEVNGTVVDAEFVGFTYTDFSFDLEVTPAEITIYKGQYLDNIEYDLSNTGETCNECYDWSLDLKTPLEDSSSYYHDDSGSIDDDSISSSGSFSLSGADNLDVGSYTYSLEVDVEVIILSNSANTDNTETKSVDFVVHVINPLISDIEFDVSESLYTCLENTFGSATPLADVTSVNLSSCNLSANDTLDIYGLAYLLELDTLVLPNYKLQSISEFSYLNFNVDRTQVRFDLTRDVLEDFVTDPSLVDCILDNATQQGDAENGDLTTLNCSGYGIYDLTGLGYFTALQQIDLSNNALSAEDFDYDSDIYLLAYSYNLTILNISQNDVYYSRIEQIRSSWNLTSFLPLGDLPTAPEISVEKTVNGLNVSWFGDFGADRYDLSIKLSGESYFTSYSNISTPFALPIDAEFNNYEIQLKSTNDVGDITTTVSKQAPVFSAYGPIYSTGNDPVTLRINDVSIDDEIVVDGISVPFTVTNGNYVTFTAPPLSAGTYTVAVTNDLGASEIELHYVQPLTAAHVEVGGATSCALSDGVTKSLSCWGRNHRGQLGLDGYASQNFPQAVQAVSESTSLNLGGEHGCSVASDGTVTCWGSYSSGMRGDPSTTYGYSNEPNVVPNIVATPTFLGVPSIATGINHTCAVSGVSDAVGANRVKCWGFGYYGQMGNGSSSTQYSPSLVSNLTAVTGISVGHYHSCAVSNSNVYCWGYNSNGQIGDNSQTNRYTPVQVTNLSNVFKVSSAYRHNCALLNSGQVSCWGSNEYGQLGNENSAFETTPVTVPGITDAVDISVGSYHSCAVLSTGSVKCWGYNNQGQLGNGTFEQNSVPQTAVGINDARNISVSGGQSCITQNDNSVKCWGENTYGQLGNGGSTHSPYPISVLEQPQP